MSQWSESDVLRINAQRRRRDDPGCAATGLTKTPEWVAKDALEILGAKPSKYRNVKTVVDGIMFDSKAEAEYWLLLKAREAAGEIHDVRRQVSFSLFCPEIHAICADTTHDATTDEHGRRTVFLEVARYVADFVFTENGVRRVLDRKTKGTRTRLFALKRKWLELQSGVVIEEV